MYIRTLLRRTLVIITGDARTRFHTVDGGRLSMSCCVCAAQEQSGSCGCTSVVRYEAWPRPICRHYPKGTVAIGLYSGVQGIGYGETFRLKQHNQKIFDELFG